MISILVADDHPVVRRGLKATLADDPDLSVVAEAETGREALQTILSLSPAIAILDIDMPDLSGIAVARELSLQTSVGTRVIFMTFHADEDLMRAAMAAGGRGYLLKGSDTEEICDAVHAVSSGRTYIGSKMAAILYSNEEVLNEDRDGATRKLRGLTATEKSVLQLLSEGLSSKEIAVRLNISYRTVENHRTNTCRKLGLDGTNALSRFALQYKGVLASLLTK